MKRDKAAAQKHILIYVSYMTIAMLGAYVTIYQYTVLNFTQLFEFNAVMMGVLIGIQYFGMAMPPLFLGLLSAKIGKKKVLLLAYSFLILGTLLVGLSHSFVFFMGAVFVIGAGFSVTEATFSAVLMDEFEGQSTKHLNFSQVAFSVGALAGPVIAQTLIGIGIYFKSIYLFASVVFFILAVAFLFTKHYNDKPERKSAQNGSELLAFFKNKFFLMLGFSVFLYVGIENTFANFADSYFELYLGKPEVSAYALALFWGAMIPSRFIAGAVRLNTKKMFALCAAIIFASSISAIMIPDITLKAAMFALCGFGCGPLFPLLLDSAAKVYKGPRGLCMNIMLSFSSMGGAALPLLSGVFVSATNQAAAYFLCAATVLLFSYIYLRAIKATELK